MTRAAAAAKPRKSKGNRKADGKPNGTLTDRVAQLEQDVAVLRARLDAAPAPAKDWRRAIGMFGDDPMMKEIFDEALKFRERDRERARRRWGPKGRRK